MIADRSANDVVRYVRYRPN